VRVAPIGMLFEKIRLAAWLAVGNVAPPNVRRPRSGDPGRYERMMRRVQCWLKGASHAPVH
jgi:hypothetical protein